jgi:hypothetical protein
MDIAMLSLLVSAIMGAFSLYVLFRGNRERNRHLARIGKIIEQPSNDEGIRLRMTIDVEVNNET